MNIFCFTQQNSFHFNKKDNAKQRFYYGLSQGWANFSPEGPDLKKLLKPRAARWLENKVKTFFSLFFFGDHSPRTNVISFIIHSPRTNVISKIKGFHLVFHFNFAPLRLIFVKITAIRDL